MRVLVVEDERELGDAIADGLRQHSLAVDVVYDGSDALEKVMVNEYDVVILDRDLPLVTGDTTRHTYRCACYGAAILLA